MTIYYWTGATGAEDLLSEHSDTICRLLTGDYDKNDLEKLRTVSLHPIYSFRLNQTARLLFTTRQGCLHVLEFLPTHDYQKSRFLKTGVLKRHLDRHAGDEMPIHFSELAADEPVLVFDDSIKTERPISLDYYNQQFIRLSEEQTGVIERARLPMILNGQAGAGKTLVGTLLMARAVEGSRVLYVTKEQHLVKKIEDNYACIAQDSLCHAEFKTYDTLIAPYCADMEIITRDFFNAWFNHLKATDTRSAKVYYQEFRICSGFSRAEYLSLGARQSMIPPEQRNDMYDMYERYLGHLVHHRKIDPAFSAFEVEACYDMIVVDEAQNFSLQQLLQLARLTTDHAIVYCMDPNQNMIDATPIRVLLTQLLRSANVSTMSLGTTYRYSECVGQALNKMLALKHRIVGGKIDKEEAGVMAWADGVSQGEFFLMTPDKLHEHAWIDARSGHLSVVTTAALLDEAKSVFKTPLVFTPAQIQGQEFHTVVIYKLLSDAKKMHVIEKQASAHRAKPGELDHTHAPYLSEYYTACSRAIDTLVIIEEKNHTTMPFLALLDMPESSNVPETVVLSPVDWHAMAEEQRARGNIQVAEAIHADCIPTQPVLSTVPDTKQPKISPVIVKKRSPKKPIVLALPPTPPKPIVPCVDHKLGHELIRAAEKGKTKEVKKLLSHPAIDPNYISDGKLNALIMAAQNGHDQVVSLLLKSPKIDPTLLPPFDGRTPLIVAARNNHSSVIKVLLNDPRIDVNGQCHSSISALICAAQYGSLSVLRLLLKAPNIQVNLATYMGGTALITASQYNQVDVITELLDDDRVNVNYQDINGISALMMAIEVGAANSVKQLLTHPQLNVHLSCPYSPEHRNQNPNCTALFRAVMSLQNHILPILLDDDRILIGDVLPKMISDPTYVAVACRLNRSLLEELNKRRDILWMQIKSRESLGLTQEEHIALLKAIRNSEGGAAGTTKHILHFVLFAKRISPGFFSDRDTIAEELDQLLASEESQDEAIACVSVEHTDKPRDVGSP